MTELNKKLKSQIVGVIKSTLNNKCTELLDSINSIRQSQVNETKSSAGDKFETSREMMQVELDKNQAQMAKAQKMLHQLLQIDLNKKHITCEFGSLVKTNNGFFLLGIPLGKVNYGEQTIFVISLASPLGQFMLNKKKKETFQFQNINYIIQEIQ